MTLRVSVAIAALAVLAGAACVPGGAVRGARRQVEAGDLDAARTALEGEKRRRPRSADVRVALGEVYYRIARDALDRTRDEARYLAFLERSVDEFVTAAEIDPTDDQPHFFLAVMDTYRGDIWKAKRGFHNTLRLNPTGTAYTNLAEIYVYVGHLHKARRWNELGMRKGASYGAVVFNDMLIGWKDDDLRQARHAFAVLQRSYPETLRTLNAARLPEAPRSFEDFAGHCCLSPACGPYMKVACRRLALEVREREISAEAVLRELRIEIERERRLREVYRQRKELEIEIEEPARRP